MAIETRGIKKCLSVRVDLDTTNQILSKVLPEADFWQVDAGTLLERTEAGLNMLVSEIVCIA